MSGAGIDYSISSKHKCCLKRQEKSPQTINETLLCATKEITDARTVLVINKTGRKHAFKLRMLYSMKKSRQKIHRFQRYKLLHKLNYFVHLENQILGHFCLANLKGEVLSAVRYLLKTSNWWLQYICPVLLVALFNQSVIWMVFRLSLCFWSGRNYLDAKTMNHLVTCKCNNSSRSSSQQVCSIATVKTGDAFFVEYLPNAVYCTCIFVAIVVGMALFL